MDDLFEKIIAREISASIIYEDDNTIAFLDINPINKGHALVVPKKKFRNLFDADPEYLCHMIKTAQKVVVALRTATGASGVNLVMNNEDAAGQDVFHAHMHLVPRFERGEAFIPAKHAEYQDGEMDTLTEQIQNAIA